MPTGENLYDLLRAIVDRTGWRSEDEYRRYRDMVTNLERMAALGDTTGRITTRTEVHNVERSDVRQLPDHLLRERRRLAEGDGS